MTLVNLIVMIICAGIVLMFSLIIFAGRNKKTEMSVERCNINYCDICEDREQCFYKKEDLE